MSATITAPRPTSTLSAGGILLSEWIKLRSVRSTVWSFAIVIAVSLGISLLAALTINYGGTTPPAEVQTSIVAQASTFGVYFGQLVVAVLGVLVISGEYSTGMIRSTLTAVPKRLPALAAKAIVLFVATFVVGLVSTFGAFLVAAPILAGQGITADLGDGSFVANLVLASLYLAFVSVFALGVGTIVRSSAGGIAAALGVVLLLPTIISVIFAITQAQWATDIQPYLFSNAGAGMYSAGGTLGQGENVLVVVIWTAVSLVIGAVLLKRRDA